MTLWRVRLVPLFALACLGVCAVNTPAAAAPSAIEADVAVLSKPASGVVGVAAWRLDGRGPKILVNADQQFPMASTFKVAVAGAVLARVDKGELRLDQMLAVPHEMHVDSEVIADRFIHPGVALSVHNLIELMITQSDNTATDVMVKAAGGPGAVTAWVRGQDVSGLRVDGDTAAILRRFFSLPPGQFAQALEAAMKADPKLPERGDKPNPLFDNDPLDASTPMAMSRLLDRIFSGKALSPESTKVLVGAMERCRTGEGRIPGRMPAGTKVAHKTGTLGGSVNDVGVLTLAGGEQVVVSVFIKQSALPFEAREKVIADVARSVRDYYAFGPGR
ncbi:MAG TPA: class A beta-lactamase [Caulobacteraceae bacterium]|jgi:beta-lactamase class A